MPHSRLTRDECDRRCGDVDAGVDADCGGGGCCCCGGGSRRDLGFCSTWKKCHSNSDAGVDVRWYC